MTNGAGTVALDQVRNKLASLWLITAVVIVVIVAAETMLGAIDQNNAQSVWDWLLPTLTPTLGIILSTLSRTAFQSSPSRAVVRKSYFHLAFGLSVFYLALILASILFRQSIAVDTVTWLAKLQTSNLWLAPIQGFVALILGILFTSAKHHPAEKDK